MEHELLGTISYFCSKRKMADARIETLEVHFMVNLSLTLHSTPSFKNKTRKQNGMSTLKSSAALLRVKPASPILSQRMAPKSTAHPFSVASSMPVISSGCQSSHALYFHPPPAQMIGSIHSYSLLQDLT